MKPYLAGCGLSHIECIKKSMSCGPTLVLEDDAITTPAYQNILEVPDNCDAIYLGVSTGSPGYISNKYNENFLRIGRMLAAHAVLYISDRYKKAALEQAELFVHKLHYPWDISPSIIQEHFLVLTPNFPYYIQSDERDSEHKWQFFTDKAIQNKGYNFL
jgi:GR25 family glycosyltransferase involved in LPS biosynthesis